MPEINSEPLLSSWPIVQTQPQLKTPLQYLQQHNGQLLIGGKSLTQIQMLLGQSVFYAYDKNVIATKIAELRAVMPPQLKLHYAIKANPLPAIVHFMADIVDGFDVASQREMLIAMQSGINVQQISFAGPGKSMQELTAAIVAGICIHVESITELQRISDIALQLQQVADIALRINPDFELKAAGMKMAGGAKAFGIDQAQVFALLPQLAEFSVRLIGFHIYCGSQNLQVAAILESQRQILGLVSQLVPLCPDDLQFINLGGGLGVPYYHSDHALDLQALGQGWHQLFGNLPIALSKLQFVLELGRYLVAEAGVYACQVTDIKQSHGQNFVIVNGGLHHHLANSGNFGQVIRRNYPVALADKLDQALALPVQVAGPLCTPLDVLADKIALPEVKLGDWFVVFQSGAYGATASPQEFLGHAHVAEIML